MTRAGQLARLLGNALIAFYPAHTFEHAAARRIALLELARPRPGVHHAQRLALGRDHVGRVQIQPALGLVAQRPQARHRLAVVVQLGRILQAQHHRVLADARHRRLAVGRHHVFTADLLVAQEAVGCRRLGPVLARPGNTGARLLPQPLGQQHGTSVQTRVTQINRLKFFLRPAHRLVPFVMRLPMLRTCV